MPTYTENLTTIRDGLATLIATKTAEWIAAGMPPTFSLDGLSIDWAAWLERMTAQLKAFNDQLVAANPTIAIMRHRS